MRSQDAISDPFCEIRKQRDRHHSSTVVKSCLWLQCRAFSGRWLIGPGNLLDWLPGCPGNHFFCANTSLLEGCNNASAVEGVVNLGSDGAQVMGMFYSSLGFEPFTCFNAFSFERDLQNIVDIIYNYECHTLYISVDDFFIITSIGLRVNRDCPSNSCRITRQATWLGEQRFHCSVARCGSQGGSYSRTQIV